MGVSKCICKMEYLLSQTIAYNGDNTINGFGGSLVTDGVILVVSNSGELSGCAYVYGKNETWTWNEPQYDLRQVLLPPSSLSNSAMQLSYQNLIWTAADAEGVLLVFPIKNSTFMSVQQQQEIVGTFGLDEFWANSVAVMGDKLYVSIAFEG